jgi:hypothetical protein
MSNATAGHMTVDHIHRGPGGFWSADVNYRSTEEAVRLDAQDVPNIGAFVAGRVEAILGRAVKPFLDQRI